MTQDAKSLYKALVARDTRFDGLFFVGVTSTRIYCRPICPVKPPKEINCRFFDTAQEAEQARFRPCLRCRPELAPGHASIDTSQRIAHQVVRHFEETNSHDPANLETIAREFNLSSRQIRRIIQNELGVPPIQLLLTRRLLLAKQLLTETNLQIIEIALASGFSSLRRFNDAFLRRYGMPPTRLRKNAVDNFVQPAINDTSTLQLSYRPPYDWPGILSFLKARELKGVEWITDSFYARTVRLSDQTGWIKVSHLPAKNSLLLEFTHTLTPALPTLLSRLRDLFDLNARPDLVAQNLGKDPTLGLLVKTNPGLRVPGAFDPFEIALRAILGQQITVQAATTIAGRLTTAFGDPIQTPFPQTTRLTPTASKIADASVDKIARLGIVATRAKCILALAKTQHERGFHPNPEKAIEQLSALPGIGPWTAQYLAMRALRWPDAFPKEDIALRNRLGGITPKQAEQISQTWRPWRSYAVMHLWNSPIPKSKSPPNAPARAADRASNRAVA